MDHENDETQCYSCNKSNEGNQDTGPACLDYKETVIAQYANSPVLLSLINAIDKKIKVCDFFNDFYHIVWNINTAQGFGLDIWGRIVGVSRTVRTFTGVFWGFNEESLLIARPYYDITKYNDSLLADKKLEQYYSAVGMFRDFQGKDDLGIDLMEEFTFNDDDFRKLILAKAYANISDYSISNINFLLMALLATDEYNNSSGNQYQYTRSIYVQDNFDMSLTIKLDWLPTKKETALIYNTGLLSRPAGVEMQQIDIKVKEVE